MGDPGAEQAFVALGSNLGDRAAHLGAARAALAGLPETRLVAASRVEETAPLAGMSQPPYLNQMVLLETRLGPRALLDACQAIEHAEGRVRSERWGARTLDLDIVRYGRRHVAEPGLIIPHPELPNRDFWLRELAELEPMSADARPLTVPDLLAMKASGRRIVMLTCYDAAFARLLEQADVDVLLVGDSLNQVLAGRDSTLSATLDQMIYHAASVRRGSGRALVFVDLPFLTYQVSVPEAIRNAGRVLQETGAHGVKLEGGRPMAETVRALVDRGIPVLGHLGLTPQSVHALGGYRVQGRDDASAERLSADALALEEAGACGIVLELLPSALAGRISAALTIPTIGIGAGPGCDGQVLVLHDMLGLNEGFSPKFLKHYAELGQAVRAAVRGYASEVRQGSYPGPEHSFD
ncbi:MAG TPA: 3-methyl-2-oxobutanoate hydroxymethyltransferase [Gemmatimonadales bacterium]|nr:3-methyl-2-oxobutanoate hydroxymethyltransferase [Gemmatimonadales bacterium]